MFGDNGETITAMVSSDGEIVQLSKPVRIVSEAEVNFLFLKQM